MTLAGGAEITMKSLDIKPLSGTVAVRGDRDSNVVFTDLQTGEKHEIGYITQGISETITLQKNQWYSVEAAGNITLSPVNTREK